MKQSQGLWLLIIAFLLTACSASKPFYSKKELDWTEKKMPDSVPEYVVYFVGGLDYEGSTSVEAFDLLKKNVNPEDTSHAIVFLNDRIYRKKKQKETELSAVTVFRKIDDLLVFLKKDKGKLIFVAGHDRANGRKNFDPGEVKKYVEEKTGKKDLFYPENNCPGPDKIKLPEDILLIPVNTSYWQTDDHDDESDCGNTDYDKWLADIEEEIDDNQRKNIIVLGHHPVYNMGNYGGFFSIKQHLLPFTDLNKNLYIPLPVIGTLYPMFRVAAGFKNDRSYPVNNRMRKDLPRTFYGYDNLVYVSGLERNFQYLKINRQDYIITGSADEPRWTGHMRSKFAYAGNGFVKMLLYKSGAVWVEFIVPGDSTGTVVYRKRLKDNIYKSPDDSTSISPEADVSDSTITIVANRDLEVGKFKTLMLGEHYRAAWTTPVQVPLIDLQQEKGGLEIMKKGGGFQTKSLHLKSRSGEEWTLRSVVKYPENLLGPMMANTIAADIVRDQSSSSHPYSAFVLERLSESAGVMHVDPEVRFIPNDEALAEYRKEFANTLAVLEKRADGDMDPAGNFNYVEEAISSDNLLKEMKKNNKVKIDDYMLLNSRLFDMWINDWDRHEGQWRWGKMECDENRRARCDELNAKDHYYIPIPKDRDQAFGRYDGVLPWIAGRKWAGRRFQDFKEHIRDVPGLNFNARNFDHAFLSRLNRSQWDSTALSLQKDLTDSRIERAIKQLPDTIYKIDGERLIRVLKARRDQLPSIAKRQYEYLSRYVDVVGSDEKEIFEVKRIDDKTTVVRKYDGEEASKQLLYERTFRTGETKEIRIYGRGGEDIFTLDGNTDRGILVRVIGGGGRDSISDNSHVDGLCRKTKIYDDKDKNALALSNESRDLTSHDKYINDYKYKSYRYNLVAPAVFVGYNRDDGVYLGGGVLLKSYGFRKDPYAFRQRIVANISLLEGSFNLLYDGDFIKVIRKWGVHIETYVLAPKSITNFFGLGNETKRITDDDEYYRLRYDAVVAYPGLKRQMGKYHSLKIGPAYSFINVEQTPGRFITSDAGSFYLPETEPTHFLGGKLEYEFVNIDDSVLTFRGIKFLASAITQEALGSDTSYTTTELESRLSIFVPIANRSVLALRVGGATRVGDYAFYHANTLGGFNVKRENGNLRGHLRGRYAGRTSLYFNNDLRIKLFTFRTYLFPAHFGVVGFYDIARVWVDHEESSVWHNGYGAGIWIDPFAWTVFNLNYAASKEEKLITLTMGFLF